VAKAVEQELAIGLYATCRHASETGKNGDLIVGVVTSFGTVLNKQGEEVPSIRLHNFITQGVCEKEITVFRDKNCIIPEVCAERLLARFEAVFIEEEKKGGTYGDWQKAAMKSIRMEGVRIAKAVLSGKPHGYE
jgi:hypothetical protein